MKTYKTALRVLTLTKSPLGYEGLVALIRDIGKVGMAILFAGMWSANSLFLLLTAADPSLCLRKVIVIAGIDAILFVGAWLLWAKLTTAVIAYGCASMGYSQVGQELNPRHPREGQTTS